MLVVVDASAATRYVANSGAGTPFEPYLDESHHLCAPDIYPFELTNSFWKYVRAGLETLDEAERHITEALELIDTYFPAGEMYREVLSESVRLGHSAYDVYYLVLARRLMATLLTCDQKLAKLAESNGVRVVLG